MESEYDGRLSGRSRRAIGRVNMSVQLAERRLLMLITGNRVYHRPETMKDLLQLLTTYGEDAKLLAGGTDLVLQMKLNKWPQTHIIDVKEIQEAEGIRIDDQYVKIGFNVKLTELLAHPEIKSNYKALWDSVDGLADVQVRNRATLAGNICNASPAADTVPPLMSYGSVVRILSERGERTVALDEFFVGPGKTVLKPDEMVESIWIPRRKPNTYCSFQKLGRLYDDIAVLNAAVQIEWDSEGTCSRATIVMGAVGPTALRAKKAEAMLTGAKWNDELVAKAADQAKEESSPITDVRASAEYRKHSIGVYVKRALLDAWNQYQSRF